MTRPVPELDHDARELLAQVDAEYAPSRADRVRVHARVRSIVPRLAGDRPPAPDIEAIARMIADGSLEASCDLEVK